VNEVLARLRDVFVELPPPGAAAPPRVARTPQPAPQAAVLGRGEEAVAVGSAAALALAASFGARCALLCVWPPRPGALPALRVPAFPAARRLSRGLAARGLDAHAAGRLARLALPAQPAEAATAATAALAAARVPGVVALTAARPRSLDLLLEEMDVLLVGAGEGTDLALSTLALAATETLRPPAVACTPALSPVPRLLAAAGLMAAGGMGAGVAEALEVAT